MVDIINEYIKNNNDLSVIADFKECDDKTKTRIWNEPNANAIEKISKDPNIVIIEYIDSNKDKLSNKNIKITDLYQMIQNYITINNYETTLSWNILNNTLINSFNIKKKVIKENGIHQIYHIKNLMPIIQIIIENPVEIWINKNYILTHIIHDRVLVSDVYNEYIITNPVISKNKFGKLLAKIGIKSICALKTRFYTGIKK